MLSGSASAMSTSNSSNIASSLPPSSSARMRSKLSPVREGRHSEEKSAEGASNEPIDSHATGSGFEMVTAAVESGFEMVTPAIKNRSTSQVNGASASGVAHHSAVDDMFTRRPVPPVHPAKSALTAMLASSSASSSSNPFTEFYSAISGRSESESASVCVYFPHARKPSGQMMELNVRKDATVEEVLGFALWTYWEEGWLPKLDEGLEGEDDPKWAVKCSAVGWILRIAEEDGEVDEDFPRLY